MSTLYGRRNAPVDVDRVEVGEWLQSLDEVLEDAGPQRVTQLLGELL